MTYFLASSLSNPVVGTESGKTTLGQVESKQTSKTSFGAYKFVMSLMKEVRSESEVQRRDLSQK